MESVNEISTLCERMKKSFIISSVNCFFEKTWLRQSFSNQFEFLVYQIKFLPKAPSLCKDTQDHFDKYLINW